MRKYKVFGTDGKEYQAVCESLTGCVDIQDDYGYTVDEALLERALLIGHFDDYHSAEIWNFAML